MTKYRLTKLQIKMLAEGKNLTLNGKNLSPTKEVSSWLQKYLDGECAFPIFYEAGAGLVIELGAK